MTRLLLAAAAAAIAFAAPASANERVFTHEGVTYAYTTTTEGGALVLKGAVSTGGKFRFVVKDGWVRGYAPGGPVSFRTPKRGAIAVAQR